MKNIKLILIFFCLSCSTQKVQDKQDTLSVLNSYDECANFSNIYKDIDQGAFFKEELIKFSKVKNGVFFYKILHGFENGKITYIEFKDNDILAYNRTFSKQNNFIIPPKVQKKILSLLDSSIEKKCYSEEGKILSNDNFYVMIVSKNGQIYSQYFIHGNLNFEKQDKNLDIIRNLLKIMYGLSLE